jgi:hypothetical protein
MTSPSTSDSDQLRLQLAGALRAAGIEPDDARIEALLPAYQGMLAGAARVRDLDLGETEPAVIFRLPPPEA